MCFAAEPRPKHSSTVRTVRVSFLLRLLWRGCRCRSRRPGQRAAGGQSLVGGQEAAGTLRTAAGERQDSVSVSVSAQPSQIPRNINAPSHDMLAPIFIIRPAIPNPHYRLVPPKHSSTPSSIKKQTGVPFPDHQPNAPPSTLHNSLCTRPSQA